MIYRAIRPCCCFTLVALCLAATSVAGQPAVAKKKTVGAHKDGLSLAVRAWFKKERRGDGSPIVHYRYILTNKTARPIHLSLYWQPFRITRLGPRSAFRVRKMQRRPHRLRPPAKKDVLIIAPRARKVIKDWQWSSSFELDAEDRRFLLVYKPKKPARVSMRICFTGGWTERLKKYLPAGAKFWTGQLCARPVRVKITQLASE